MSAVSLYYYLSVLKQAFVKESDATAEKLSFGHWLAIGVPAAALVVLGIYPAWIMGPVMNAVAACLAG
jgi:NADH:ubiquinone oxidoreductase subunit 2 (subunit N)